MLMHPALSAKIIAFLSETYDISKGKSQDCPDPAQDDREIIHPDSWP